ncbi:hypothetical protein EDC56_3871, partial [Sinobacterium caligoides]
MYIVDTTTILFVLTSALLISDDLLVYLQITVDTRLRFSRIRSPTLSGFARRYALSEDVT